MKSRLALFLIIVGFQDGLSGPQAAIAQEPRQGDLYNQAVALVKAGQLANADEPLSRLLAQENTQMTHVLMFRASLRAETGRFQNAALDLEQVIQINPSNDGAWSTLAPLLVQTGEIAKYRTYCKEMLLRFKDTSEATIANRVAKSCLLMPGALDKDELLLAENLADKSVALSKEGEFWPWRNMTAALAEFRRGGFAHASEMTDHFQKQISDALRSGQLTGNWDTCTADSYFISAMAHQRLKEVDKARAALEQGQALVRTGLPPLNSKDLGSAWWDVLWTYIVMSEADTVIGASQPAQP